MKNKLQNSHFTITAVIPNLRPILTVGLKWMHDVKFFKKKFFFGTKPSYKKESQ